MGTWDSRLAETWTYCVPPSRPSALEMAYYTRYAEKLREERGQRLRVLALGSTPEFRDWACDLNYDLTVVDKSESYHRTITRELRHKHLVERLVVCRWEDMDFCSEFDVVVGDLAVGNVEPSRFVDFASAVARALVPGGLFMGKSFIWPEGTAHETVEDILADYRQNGRGCHPYTFINHRLGLCVLDRQRRTINFADMHSELLRAQAIGLAGDDVMAAFDPLGWDEQMVATFFAPSQREFMDVMAQWFDVADFGGPRQLYTDVFPTFVLMRKEDRQ